MSASASGPNAPKVEVISILGGGDAEHNQANTGGGLTTGEVAEVSSLPLPLEEWRSRLAARRVRSVWRVQIQVGPAASSNLTSTYI